MIWGRRRVGKTYLLTHFAGGKRAVYFTATRQDTGGSPDPLYELADHYLAFWFAVLRDDADLIEGGQGRPVQARTAGRWQTHIGRVFEAAARDHVQRLVGAGQLPPDTVVGRWWRDEAAEIDVLALSADGPAMVGECRWQSKEITERDLAELRRKAVHLPPPSAAGTTYAFWSRGGVQEALARHPDVRSFTPRRPPGRVARARRSAERAGECCCASAVVGDTGSISWAPVIA